MDGVAFADGIHHLIDEELETAAFVGSQRMGAGEVAVEIVERVALRAGFVGTVFEQDLPSVAGDRFLAFGDDVLEHVIALLHGIGGEGELGEVAVLESIDLRGEPFERQSSNRIRDVSFPVVHNFSGVTQRPRRRNTEDTEKVGPGRMTNDKRTNDKGMTNVIKPQTRKRSFKW